MLLPISTARRENVPKRSAVKQLVEKHLCLSRIEMSGPDFSTHQEYQADLGMVWGMAICWIVSCVLSGSAAAGDWPQILGPSRNGIAEEEHLSPRWRRGGPPELWRKPVGAGMAGVAIVGDRAALFHRVDNAEILEILDVRTGETLSQDASRTTFQPQSGHQNGPLCVPVISGNFLVSYGAQGLLTCLDFRTGQRRWQRNTHQDFKVSEGDHGAGSTPIVVDDRVIVNVGGDRMGAGIVAFALATGEPLWKQTNESASDSAPVLVEINGMKLVVLVTRSQCLMLDPASGVILFQFPFGQRGPVRNGANPVIMQDRLLVTASNGTGMVYGEFDLFGFRPLYVGRGPIATQYCTPIHQNGFVYVIDGCEDVPPADLKCIELADLHSKTRASDQPVSPISNSTALKWTEQNFGYGTLLLADDKLIAVKNSGELLLIKPSPEALHIVSRCRPLKGFVRALPALSHGKLLIRNEKTLLCLELGR